MGEGKKAKLHSGIQKKSSLFFCYSTLLHYLCSHKVNKNDRNSSHYRVNNCYLHDFIVCESDF